MCADLVWGLDAVIKILEAEHEANGDDSPHKNGQQKIGSGVWSRRSARYFGRVDDPYVGRPQLLREARFLHSLEQRFEHLAVAGRVALQRAIGDSLAVLSERLVLLCVERRHEILFAGERRQVFVVNRLDNFVNFRVELSQRGVDGRSRFDHVRVLVAERLRKLGLFVLRVRQL